MVRSLTLLAAFAGAALAAEALVGGRNDADRDRNDRDRNNDRDRGGGRDQTGEVDIILFGSRADNLVASVVRADSTAATFAVNCAPGARVEDCNRSGTWTIVQGPRTFASYQDDSPPDGNGRIDQGEIGCQLDPARNSASCTFANQGGANPAQPRTTVVPNYSQLMVPLRITDGAERLRATPTGFEQRPPRGRASSRFPMATRFPGGNDGEDWDDDYYRTPNAAAPAATAPAVLAGAAAVVGAMIL